MLEAIPLLVILGMDGIMAQTRVIRGQVSPTVLEELLILTGKEKQHQRTDWALQAKGTVKGEGQSEQRLPIHLIKLIIGTFVMLLSHHGRWNDQALWNMILSYYWNYKKQMMPPKYFLPLKYAILTEASQTTRLLCICWGVNRERSLPPVSAEGYPCFIYCAVYTIARMHKAAIWEVLRDELHVVITAIDSPFFFTWHFTSGWSMISQTATQLRIEPNALRCQPRPWGL